MTFLRRSSHFDISTFMKTFRGHKNEFQNLNKEQLAHLLRFAFSTKDFPLELFIDYLIESKWDFNEQLQGGSLPLILACTHGKLEIVKKMIGAGADVRAKEADDVGALEQACQSGNLELVQHLLDLNLDVNSRSASGHSPIFSAVISGHHEIFVLLLNHGADTKTPNKMGTTLLHSAASHNSLPMVEKLIELGADINAEDNFGKNVLHYASKPSHHQMMKRLIELGAPVATYCQKSDFACDLAVMFNDIEMLKLFIANGANLERNNLNILFCINRNADFDCRDYDASEVFLCQKTSLKMIEFLLTLNQDINQQCPKTGESPLMLICLKGTLEQAILFLDHGADPNLIDSQGRTALHYAARGDKPDIIAHLVKICKMDVNSRTNTGQTPLHCYWDEDCPSPAATKCLLELGADINTQDNQKQTPLHVFTQLGNEKIVDLLLKSGARNNIFDYKSKRPIDLCSDNNMRKIYAKYSIYQYSIIESIFFCFS